MAISNEKLFVLVNYNANLILYKNMSKHILYIFKNIANRYSCHFTVSLLVKNTRGQRHVFLSLQRVEVNI